MPAPTIRVHNAATHDASDYLYTALCSMPDTPRGEYDEEIDVIATGARRPGVTAIRRVAQDELDRNYTPGMKVRKIVRVW